MLKRLLHQCPQSTSYIRVDIIHIATAPVQFVFILEQVILTLRAIQTPAVINAIIDARRANALTAAVVKPPAKPKPQLSSSQWPTFRLSPIACRAHAFTILLAFIPRDTLRHVNHRTIVRHDAFPCLGRGIQLLINRIYKTTSLNENCNQCVQETLTQVEFELFASLGAVQSLIEIHWK